MEEKSKKKTIRRLSWYWIWPGEGVVIVVLAASGSWNWSSRLMGGGGSGSEAMCWYSKTEIFCGLPSSRTMKSLALSPSIGLPDLSLAETSTITRLELALNVVGALLDETWLEAVVRCWAGAGISSARINRVEGMLL